MLLSNRIVTEIPINSLWTNQEELSATRIRYLNKESIKQLFTQRKITFVLADVGRKLEWIAPENCYEFWKKEVLAHLADDYEDIYVDTFPEGYAFIASEWTGTNNDPIILLEKYH
ncbi:hypothetical protein L0U88_18825 [Flavihumibacter sp. RY-1]|uniref:Uncharacterized protein n=1 Tax=Flavihumibacter fluminis TaxID=2909236 RepID=A0ABS9BNL9_9BACT|nr:hypothetical protein [Flavihumibacter fluminis]MCF1716703.1 hypothetical protein [Flavihumibacter fluminis]